MINLYTLSDGSNSGSILYNKLCYFIRYNRNLSCSLHTCGLVLCVFLKITFLLVRSNWENKTCWTGFQVCQNITYIRRRSYTWVFLLISEFLLSRKKVKLGLTSQIYNKNINKKYLKATYILANQYRRAIFKSLPPFLGPLPLTPSLRR